MFYNKLAFQQRGGGDVAARRTTCSFTGHRPGKLPWGFDEGDARCVDLKRRIRDAVEAAYQEGYRHFLCGMAMGCDLYFCESVLALRARHPEVTVGAAIPCPTQADEWPEGARLRYRTLVAACDEKILLSDRYTPSCMYRRNRYLVDHAALLIAAYDGTAGGTRYTIQYAMGRGLNIVDLPIVLPAKTE
jgi:uncharacterized phage-like protein YoqJ